jgi:hypothetical protein
MKVKVDSLIGKALDWAVAMAENPNREQYVLDIVAFGYHPSIDWYDGGIIIEREEVTLERYGDYPNWTASLTYEEKEFDGVARAEKRGPTPLIAAMRAYVASKMGDEIEVPEELQ